MFASEIVKEEEGGEPKQSSASGPVTLLDLSWRLEPGINAGLKPDVGSLSLFAESLSFELHRSLRGAAQLIGAEASVGEPLEPQQCPDLLGQNLQMAGRAVGGLLPMLSIAVGTRYGFGERLTHDAQAVEDALLKRTRVGLSVAESGASGFLYGSLLTPTEGPAKDDLGSFAFDRVRSGASSGLAFTLMSASSIGLSKLASTELGAAIGAEKLMRIGAVNGIVSGIPGGIANVESDSLVRTGKLDFDRERLARSMYEMSLFGGVFGLGTGMLSHVRVERAQAQVVITGSGADLTQPNARKTPEQLFATNERFQPAANDNVRPAANDNWSLLDRSHEMKLAVGDYQVMAPDAALLPGEPGARGHFAVIRGGKDVLPVAAAGRVTGDGGAGRVISASMASSQKSVHDSRPGQAEQQGAGAGLRIEASTAPVSFEAQPRSVRSRAEGTRSRLGWTLASLTEAINGGNLYKADLRGLDLTGIDFGEANLESADFTGSILRNVDFSKVRSLHRARFRAAEMSGVDLRGRDLTQVLFIEATFRDVKFDAARLKSTDFQGADLRGADFSRVEYINLGKFEGADIGGANFSGQDLYYANFQRVKNVTSARFEGAVLKSANFQDAQMTLSKFYAPDSEIMRRVKQMKCDKYQLEDAAKFITVNPVLHREILESEIKKGVAPEFISEERLLALSEFQGRYGQDSPVMRSLAEAERYSIDGAMFLPNLLAFAEEQPERNYHIIDLEASKGVRAGRFDVERLEGLQLLEEYFEDDQVGLRHLLALEENGVIDASKIADFIQENPQAHKQLVLQEMEKAEGPEASGDQLKYSRLKALSSLNAWFGQGSDIMLSVLNLEQEGLILHELAEVLNEDPIKLTHIQTLITEGAPVEKVREAIAEDADSLAHYLSPSGVQYVEQLADQGLRKGELRTFLAESPAARSAVVEELIRNSATKERFHDQMRLSMLPNDVATTLLDKGQVPVGPIIAAMRNWQSGVQFRELLIEQVRSGQAPSLRQVKRLAVQAKELARDSQETASSEAKPLASNGGRTFADESAFLVRNPRAIEAAKIINEAVRTILEEIPEGKTIVVLGRDAQPLYPALRNSGRNAQYFLWSRLQEGDKATRKQWLREVAPGAVVIDTGYAGSILDAIYKVDPTISAYLLSSKGAYPQLLKSHDHSAIVDNLEYFPKLVARTATYTEKGGAVSRKWNTDEHDDEELRTNRWTVESLNRQFLRAIGLDEWGAWRYSQYVGLRPEERLGLNTPSEVAKHYSRVRKLRRATASDASC